MSGAAKEARTQLAELIAEGASDEDRDDATVDADGRDMDASEAASVVVVAASVDEAPSRARPHRGRRRSGEGGCIVDHSTLVVEDGRAASGPPANPIIPENRFVPGKEAWYHA